MSSEFSIHDTANKAAQAVGMLPGQRMGPILDAVEQAYAAGKASQSTVATNQRSGSEGLPEGWEWAWDDAWIAVMRCARRQGRRGPVDVYLTDDGILVFDGYPEVPAAVARAVLGVS